MCSESMAQRVRMGGCWRAPIDNPAHIAGSELLATFVAKQDVATLGREYVGANLQPPPNGDYRWFYNRVSLYVFTMDKN